MKKVASSSGFTIVETMIVLAVTGLLFAAMAGGWSTRQHNNEFLTAMQDARQRVQQVASEVDNGYFPNSNTQFSCTISAGALSFPGSSTEQGRNADCIFLGKALQFKVGNSSPELIKKYAIAGLSSAKSIDTAKPTLASRLTEPTHLPPDLVTQSVMSGSTEYAGIAFISEVGAYDAKGKIKSGRQSVNVYGIKNSIIKQGDGSLLDDSSTTGTKLYDSVSPTGQLYERIGTAGIKVCLKSTRTSNFAILTVGAGGSGADVQATSATNCSGAV